MIRKFLLLTFLILGIASTPAFAERLLFLDENCPHCQNVDNLFKQNNYYQQFGIESFEVTGDKLNELFYLQKAKELGVENLLLPFLVDDKNYYMGESEIINHVESLIKSPDPEDPDKDAVLSPSTLDEKDAKLFASLLEESSKNESKDLSNNQEKSENKISPYYFLVFIVLAISILIYQLNRFKKMKVDKF